MLTQQHAFGPGTLDVFGKAGASDARIHYLDRLRAIPLVVTRLLSHQRPLAIKSQHQPITPGYLPLERPLSPTAPCAKWLRYPIGTCANRLSTATGDYIIITTNATNVTLEDYAREN